MSSSLPFVPSTDVASALQRRAPVVALESTIITHGMPWPQNLEMAREVEDIVRAQGAVPATIVVLNGTLHVGLSDEQLMALAQTKDAMKVSRADIAYAVSSGRTGATTVAATMIAANLAGIEVFATGGVGGVHRGAEESFDISADLEELARTNVCVVCAGAKAILDLRKTFEVLETKGVPVVGYGVDELPAFWSRTSGLPAPIRCDTPAEIARFQRARTMLGIEGGMLIANPLASDEEIDAATVSGWIEEALTDAQRQNVSGKAVTPFLLSRIFTLSGGRSLTANIALVKSNAALAARIASALRA